MVRTAAALVISALLAHAASSDNNEKAQEFAFTMHDGKEVRLSDYRGKVVVLAFIFTNCPHCQRTTEVLSRLQKEYGSRIQILAVAFNDTAPQLLPGFVERFSPGFPVGYAPRARVYGFLGYDASVLVTVPVIVIVDRQGKQRLFRDRDSPFFKDAQDDAFRNALNLVVTSGKKR